jgi:hypothetical protein
MYNFNDTVVHGNRFLFEILKQKGIFVHFTRKDIQYVIIFNEICSNTVGSYEKCRLYTDITAVGLQCNNKMF